MTLLDAILNVVIPGRARRLIDRDPRYIAQQCAGTLETAQTHLLRTGYIARNDTRERAEERQAALRERRDKPLRAA